MIRKFVAGIVWGGVVATVGLGAVSVLAPLNRAANGADAPVVVAADPVAAGTSAVAGTEAGAAAPAVKDAPAEAVITLEGASEGAAEAGTKATVTPEAVPGEAEPVAEAPAPAAPEAAAAALESPEPATPDAVAPSEAPPQSASDAPVAPAAPGDALPAPDVLAQSDAAPSAQAPGVLGVTADAGDQPVQADLPPPVPETKEVLLTPAPDPAPETAPAALTMDPAPADEPLPEPALPKIIVPDPAKTRASSPAIAKTVEGVTINRLPSIAAKPTPAEGEAAAATAPLVVDARPVAQFARSFANEANKPLFAVLLLDTGAADVDRANLAALPFAISFVIDPLDPGAASAAAIYRAAGQEVIMLASGLPEGATAGDVEQTFQANALVLPEAVAVMDLGAAGFQDNRPLASLVVPVIGAQGRGVVSFDKGLNAADQVARREAVPAAVIFRDLDAEGEDAPVIRRYLDRAAFKAAQQGRVVVLGTTRPETIAALMEWTIEGRASSVALAPLTAVLAVP